MVEKQSFMFLTGPQVIKSVTGEETDFESLGGAQVHLNVSGTAHFATKTKKTLYPWRAISWGICPPITLRIHLPGI